MTSLYRSRVLRAALVALALGTAPIAVAETRTAQATFDVDEQFRVARELAFAGEWDQAAAIAERILQAAPDYADVTVFLARIRAWQRDYPRARAMLAELLARDPANVDALSAAADVELWSGDPDGAAAFCDRALALRPDDLELTAKREKIAHAAAERAAAGTTSRADSAGEPAYRASLEYRLSTFDRDFTDWHETAVALERKTDRLALIARTTYFERFDDDAVLFEVDAYPTLRRGTYAYLSAGVSTGDVVADYRLAAELFQSLPRQTEVSLGWRQLDFGSTSNVLTGSAGVYFGAFWISFRPYLTFVSGDEEAAFTLLTRWYYGDAEEYGQLRLGTGKSLEEQTASEDLFTLETHSVGLELRRRLPANFVGRAGFGLERQEVPDSRNREQFSFGFGLDYLF